MTTSRLRRSLLLQSVAFAGMLMAGRVACAEAPASWPARPVTLVVGFAAGGPTDMIARILAEQLSARFGQPFVVDNKPGAGGGLAAGLVKKAAPDGYTLMFASSGTLTILPHIQSSVRFDPVRDFTAVGLVANYPYFLVTPASSSIRSVDDLLKQGGEPKAALTYGSAGIGATNHLAGEWLSRAKKLNATHIPYKGDAAAVADLIAGRVDFGFIAGVVAFPQVKAGKLRLLASASATPGRGPAGVRTMREAGVKDFVAEPWNGVMGPAGLPTPIVMKLNAAINDIMKRKDVADRLAAVEQYPFTGTPQQFTASIKDQSGRWAKIIKEAGIKVE
ncbi:conserved exported hypothetical protein [Cupriavidus necator]|uniref:Extra-cytoplasmic solute receptor n=1 Tax=Cupriavidus necator TaxID=106590 RepID=A0A1K0II00_CUPNE|nr:conserved exported hypothetical protein [Cupriavidus necator]